MKKVFKPHQYPKELMMLQLHRILYPLKTHKLIWYLMPLKCLQYQKHCIYLHHMYHYYMSAISNLNNQENQMKIQKIIYLGQMIGWTHMDFRTILRYKHSVWL